MNVVLGLKYMFCYLVDLLDESGNLVAVHVS